MSGFDATTALSGMYMWLMFGLLSSLLGCDIQRLMVQNVYAKHAISLICFFFLMAVVDKNNDLNLLDTWIKAIFVYFLFMLGVKNQLFVSVAIIFLLVIDQSIKVHEDYLAKRGPVDPKWEKYRTMLWYGIVGCSIFGCVFYCLRQKQEFGTDFSWSAFLFGTKTCDFKN